MARMPTVVAAYWRLRQGLEPIAPDASLGHAANYLQMLTGERPSEAAARGLETYLNTVADHGLNASTFAARVIIATGSDMVSAVTGAIGALKGPLHGGAPGPALDMVFEIGTAECAEPYLRAKLEQGERLMGFGHRIYKVRDPRAEVLGAAARTLLRGRGAGRYPVRAGHGGGGDGGAAARRVQAGAQPADQRRVLHRPAAARPRAAGGAVHADLCAGARGGLGGPCAGADRDGTADPAGVGVCGRDGTAWLA